MRETYDFVYDQDYGHGKLDIVRNCMRKCNIYYKAI